MSTESKLTAGSKVKSWTRNQPAALPLLMLMGLHTLPAIAATIQFGLYPLWAFGAIFFALALQSLMTPPTRLRRWIAAVLSILLAIGSTSLYTSFLFQGSGFNTQFFLHYDLQSLRVGFGQFLPLILINTVYIALCALCAFFLRPLNLKPLAGVLSTAAAGLAAFLTLGPITSLNEYFSAKAATIDIAVQAVVRNRAPVVVEPVKTPLKNIVLIYAEGLEATYMNEDIFPGLMPKMSALRKQAVEFTNVHQVMNTKWTIAGIVASQCSVPFNVGLIYGEANVGLASVDKPFGEEVCLGDILKAYGYDNTFMGGAGLGFAGKGKFLKTHGYDNLLGRSQLSKRQPVKGYVSGWGLYDDELLGFANEEIAARRDLDTPYMITALTLDTHQPDGHPSASCEPFTADDNAMLQAVYCSDQIIGQFLETQLSSEAAKDTIYILLSDHLSNRNTVSGTLEANQDIRRLSFMAWGAGLEPQNIDSPLTHFDVAPTVLDWAGIPNYRNHNWGRSVTDGRAGLWFIGDEAARDAAGDVSYISDDGGFDDVTITLDPIEIKVGNQIYKASYAGAALKHRIYVVLFDEAGDVESIGFYGSKKYLDRSKVDNWYIAVSGTPAVGHFSAEEASGHDKDTLYYAMGRNGRDDFVTGKIDDTLSLSAERLAELIQSTRTPQETAAKD